MAKISSYPLVAPDGSDILIGTDTQTGQTRNFSVDAISSFSVNAYLKKISWEFIVSDPDPESTNGKIFFNGYGGNGTNFQDITSIDLDTSMPGGTNALPYLEYLLTDDPYDSKHLPADNFIKLSNRNDLGVFGVYQFDSLTQRSGSIYTLGLSPSNESVGKIYNKGLYYIELDPIKNLDRTFIFNQGISSAVWIINHNLDCFPSVTVVDSANTTVVGDIAYNDSNSITLTFAAPFSGTAYLN